MRRARKCSIGLVSAIFGYLTIFSLHSHFERPLPVAELREDYQESAWIATSSSWVDRQACRWLGVCGALHLRKSGWTSKSQSVKESHAQLQSLEIPDPSTYWMSGQEDPSQWSQQERELREIPSYVYDYTPYVHLFSSEDFWPCDIANHLRHTVPYQNYTPIENMSHAPTLDNLDELNHHGRFTYLQSKDNVEERPIWLGGSKNIPTTSGTVGQGHEDSTPPQLLPGDSKPNLGEEGWYRVGVGDTIGHGGIRTNPATPPTDTHTLEADQGAKLHTASKRMANQTGGHSSAPAVLIVVPKGEGVVDAFWFYFYSYNLGNQVLNVRFGNHVGDWEHSVVRFQHGVPKAMFMSEHSFGEAYSYEAMEKIGKRPVVYSAVGTHAMYATPGLHPYVLPWGLLHDETDRGPLWDPLLNHHGFVYNYTSGVLRSSAQTPKAPVSWFDYLGRWGDKFYPLSDPRQYRFAGQYHYVSGPLGPKFKNLGRQLVCQGNKKCVIKNWLGGGGIREWPGAGPEDDVKDDAGVEDGTVVG